MAKRALKEEGVDDLLPKRSKKEEPTDLAVANEDDTLPKRIFVGNLDMKVTEGHILKIFSKFVFHDGVCYIFLMTSSSILAYVLLFHLFWALELISLIFWPRSYKF